MGRYLFLREIAKGPLGPLYELRAEAGSSGLDGLGRLVPLRKDLLPEVEQSVAAAAWDSMEIRHDSVLCVADVVFGEGWVVLIHDFAEGTLLRALQRRARERQSVFPVAVALRIALDVLDGQDRNFSACESAGITWNPGGTAATSLYLCGDGRTRALDGQLMTTLIRTVQMREHLNSLDYLAPELLDPEQQPDERADVFAAGAVLWELLTGQELTLENEVARGNAPRRPLPDINQSVPKGTQISQGLLQAVTAALEPGRTRRLASRRELREALLKCGEAATYEKVIEFVDALLHRESTLFRLTLDQVPKLSDKLRSERPGPPRLDRGAVLAKRTFSAQLPRVSKVQVASNLGSGKSNLVQSGEPQVKPSPRTAITAASTDSPGKQSPRTAIAATAATAKKTANRTLIGINPSSAFAPLPRTSVAIDAKPIVVEPQSEVKKIAEPISIPIVEPPPGVDTSDTDQTVLRYNLKTEIQEDLPKPVPAVPPQIPPPAIVSVALIAKDHPDAVKPDPNFVPEALRDLPNVVAAIMSDVRPISPALPATVGESLPSKDSLKPPGTQVIQLSLRVLIIMQLITVAIAVMATMLIQRTLWKNSPAPSVSASITAAPVLSAAPIAVPTLPAAAPMAAPTPPAAAPTMSVEATATAPQPSTAPSGEPSAATVASTGVVPLTPTTASAVPSDMPTAPKLVPRKSKRGYVPHGL